LQSPERPNDASTHLGCAKRVRGAENPVDLTFAIMVILAVNLAIFIAGCLLAAFRTWRPSAPSSRT
jgi:hypothetical protein